MPTGLELFGAIAGIVAILDSLTKAIQNLHSKTKKFQECESQLNDYRMLLTVQKRRLKNWKNQSIGSADWAEEWKPTGEDEEGAILVSQLVERIDAQINSIDTYLFRIITALEVDHSESQKGRDRSHLWQRMLSNINRRSLEKLSFAVYKDKYLGPHIDMLIKLVDALTAHLAVVPEQMFDPRSPQTAASNMLLPAMDERSKRLCSELSALHRALSSEGGDWYLLMSHQRSPLHCLLCQDDCLTIHLLRSWSEAQRPSFPPRLGTTYHFGSVSNEDDELISSILKGSKDVRPSDVHAELGSNLRSSYHSISSQSADDQETTEARSKLQRAHISLSIATWVVSLWSSDWVKDLCSCGIRIAYFEPATAEPDQPVIAHRYEEHAAACFDERTGARRHLVLGVLLCELALAKPVSVNVNESRPMFVVSKGDVETIDEAVMLQRVEKMSSTPFMEAMSYCFAWDRAEERRAHLDHYPHSTADWTRRPEELNKYANLVIPRLAEHLGRIESYRINQHSLFKALKETHTTRVS